MDDGPRKPLLIFDGDCGFCRRSVARLQGVTGDRVEYAPFQEVTGQFPDIPLEQFQGAVHLVEPDGRRSCAAQAVFRTLAWGGRGRLWWAYRHVPGFAGLTELGYGIVAANRTLVSRLMNLLWGPSSGPATHVLVRWLFMRLLGVVYLIAFASWWVQVDGLVGSQGIVPVQRVLDYWQQHAGLEHGGQRWWRVPTLLWLDASDAVLHGLCAAGVGLAVLVIVRIAVGPALLGLWVLYLSLCSADAVWLNYQWESLLLEAGFLALFWTSWRPWPALRRDREPGRAGLWLLRWLLFRLMLSSGVVKLLSNDTVWLDFTALQYHYFTQPLANPLSWYAHHLPLWVHKLSCFNMFVIELLAPLLFFGPRRLRMVGCALLVLLQAVIAATGNYNFFNLLTSALCITLLDDTVLRALWPQRVVRHIPALQANRLARQPAESSARRWLSGLQQGAWWAVALTLMLAGGLQTLRRWDSMVPRGAKILGVGRPMVPAGIGAALDQVQQFRLVNHYGLFTNMTEARPELMVEGSMDGRVWLPYEFKHKPGDLFRRPSQAAPHQPRLDWQMWFEALHAQRQRATPNFWFQNFIAQLQRGAPQVLALLEDDPFPSGPPKFIRVQLYLYEFTTPQERAETGAWWKRQYVRDYYRPTRLKQP